MAGAAASSALGQKEAPPNVLVIQPDQHRGMTLGCGGDEQAVTPNLDRLAAGGIRFTNAVSSSPVCSPFRGSMQTGLYCHKHGVVKNNIRLNPDFTTFAEVFGEAGYATGYIGKWHLDGGMPKGVGGYIPEGPRRQGWQEWLGYEKAHEYFKVWRYNDKQEKVRVEGYDWEPTWHTDMMLDFARRQRDAGKPWLYYVAYGPPHPPAQCLRKYLDLFPPERFRLPPDLVRQFSGDERKVRELWQLYYGEVAAIDHEVGRVLDGLKKLGVEDNTIILYCSDHGDRLGSHTDMKQGDLRGKAAPFATAFRIPLMVHWPKKVKPIQVCDALVSSVDLAPTILELAGLRVPRQMQGDSMAGWCLRGDGPRNDAIYLGLGPAGLGWRAVWDGRYIFSRGKYQVLYDHQKDPHEMENLYDSDRKLAARLNQRLLQLAGKTEDPALPGLRAQSV
jgi:arylsulfatase A-like enzyme